MFVALFAAFPSGHLALLTKTRLCSLCTILADDNWDSGSFAAHEMDVPDCLRADTLHPGGPIISHVQVCIVDFKFVIGKKARLHGFKLPHPGEYWYLRTTFTHNHSPVQA